MPDIAVRDLKVAFGEKHVLTGINLEVKSGTSTVVLGGSGSGKSVMLKVLMGLIEPNSGDVYIDHRPKNRDITQDCGMLFQSSAIFDSLTVSDNVVFGLDFENPRNKALEVLRMVDLDETVLDLYPEALSGGMRKRVSMARTICHNPQTILLDEPTTGLDPLTSATINRLIAKLHHSMGLTVITVTHDMKSTMEIADNIAMIERGAICWFGSKQEFMKTEHPLVLKFLEASRF